MWDWENNIRTGTLTRKAKLRTWFILTDMFRKALSPSESIILPYAFRQAVKVMAWSGIHPSIFKDALPLHKITISPTMKYTPFSGVYFGGVDATFPNDKTDWKMLGWDGSNRVIMFPTPYPQEWVILHEFGHYLDDIFFHELPARLSVRGHYSDRVCQFSDWRREMHYEYYRTHAHAIGAVTEEERKEQFWYELVPQDIWVDSAPSRYALVTLGEWVAEGFRKFIQTPERLKQVCPDTFKFFDFVLHGEMFRREKKYSLATHTGRIIPYAYEGNMRLQPEFCEEDRPYWEDNMDGPNIIRGENANAGGSRS